MMFQPEHIDLIRAGEKTQTRRDWDDHEELLEDMLESDDPVRGRVVLGEAKNNETNDTRGLKPDGRAHCLGRLYRPTTFSETPWCDPTSRAGRGRTMSALGIEIDADLRTRFYQAALLAVGGLLFGIANLIAGWLVGLFSATLALPANTQLAVTTLVFCGLVYAVALHTEPDEEQTVLDKLTGGAA